MSKENIEDYNFEAKASIEEFRAIEKELRDYGVKLKVLLEKNGFGRNVIRQRIFAGNIIQKRILNFGYKEIAHRKKMRAFLQEKVLPNTALKCGNGSPRAKMKA